MGLTSNNDASAYREEVNQLAKWSRDKNLSINVDESKDKNKGVNVDFIMIQAGLNIPPLYKATSDTATLNIRLLLYQLFTVYSPCSVY